MESKEKPKRKEYQYQDLTVVWEPNKCIHSSKCWKGLSSVFKPKNRPWIQLEGSNADEVRKQIEQCPSGALSYKNQNINNMDDQKSTEVRIEIISNGPLAIHSDCAIEHSNGTIEQKKNKVFLCRCGSSQNKPFCDGTHRKIEFEG